MKTAKPWRGSAAALCGLLVASGSAGAAGINEFWPELSAFVVMNPTTRLYLDGAYAKGKESDVASADLGAYLDVSFKAVDFLHPLKRRREERKQEDWQRTTAFWGRIGYDRVSNAATEPRSVAEDRGVIALSSRVKFTRQIWLESRVRADLRWIGGDYSTRYRFKLEATREFTVLDHTVVPTLNVEGFYDTRYDGWARVLYQAGAEVSVNRRFRFEYFLAHQADRLPSASSLNAVAVTAKWYY
jgi:hypothetical protein